MLFFACAGKRQNDPLCNAVGVDAQKRSQAKNPMFNVVDCKSLPKAENTTVKKVKCDPVLQQQEFIKSSQ